MNDVTLLGEGGGHTFVTPYRVVSKTDILAGQRGELGLI